MHNQHVTLQRGDYRLDYRLRYSEEYGKQSSYGHHSIVFFSYYGSQRCPKEPAYKLSSKYLPLCLTEQRHSYRFGTT